MKTIKVMAIGFVILSLALSAFADSTSVDSIIPVDSAFVDSAVSVVSDSTAVVTNQASGFWRTITLYNVFVVIVAVFEVIVRFYPTTKNYSILSLVNSVINFVFPNFKKDGGKFEK